MSCDCNNFQKKFHKLQNKYVKLKRNHKKLLGLTVLLTNALEEFVKGGSKSEITDLLLTCSSIYPDLFDDGCTSNQEISNLRIQQNDNPVQVVEETGKVFETGTESEREYYEGFMARPKIPRTPQV